MPLPKELHDKCMQRFFDLINAGDSALLGSLPNHVVKKWQVNARNLLVQILPADNPYVYEFDTYTNRVMSLVMPGERDDMFREQLAFLTALAEDFGLGHLVDIAELIEKAVAEDYMGQAERLLSDAGRNAFDHIPAAVLAGAVLEKTMRTLAARTPGVALVNNKGEPLMINSLNDELKKANAYGEKTASQVRAWAHIRNKAAHGEFDQITRQDAELMLQGVEMFVDAHGTKQK